ncbi:MAG: hypothetical protein WD489_02380 [Rhodovibrionaceae bacterium]
MQLALFILAAAIWVIGVNVLFYVSRRRGGASRLQSLNPIALPIKNLSAVEKAIFFALLTLAFLCAVIALQIGG